MIYFPNTDLTPSPEPITPFLPKFPVQQKLLCWKSTKYFYLRVLQLYMTHVQHTAYGSVWAQYLVYMEIIHSGFP